MYRVNQHEFQSFDQVTEWARTIHGIDFDARGTEVSESDKQEACRIIAEFTKDAEPKS